MRGKPTNERNTDQTSKLQDGISADGITHGFAFRTDTSAMIRLEDLPAGLALSGLEAAVKANVVFVVQISGGDAAASARGKSFLKEKSLLEGKSNQSLPE